MWPLAEVQLFNEPRMSYQPSWRVQMIHAFMLKNSGSPGSEQVLDSVEKKKDSRASHPTSKRNSHHPQAFHFRRTSRRFPVGFLEFVSRQVRARVHKQKPRSSSEREFLKKTLEFISCQTKDHLRFPLFKTQVSFKWNVICWKQKTAVCQPRQLSSYKRL